MSSSLYISGVKANIFDVTTNESARFLLIVSRISFEKYRVAGELNDVEVARLL